MIATPHFADRQAARPSTVVIADDSVVVRGLFARWLGESGRFHVVGVAGDGEAAIEHAGRHHPDIMVLDLDMPVLDGVEALPRIVKESPRTAVLLTTTLTERNARLAMQCMSMGAVDVLPKPDSRSGLTLSLDFRSELLGKLGSIAQSRLRDGEAAADSVLSVVPPSGVADLRPLVSVMPRYLVVGASTGGPRAVARVLSDLGGALANLTTLVVQHMPPLFTASFADQIAQQLGVPTREPHDGERLARGTIYVAPGGRHLGIERKLGHIVASVSDGPPVNFCRPAVDVLFADAARHLGPAALGVVMTGMGSDGTDGATALRRAGAAVIAQDEPSSTVWGMPGSVVRAGQASAVLPLGGIGPAIRSLVGGGRPA
ncbi:chemotaxis-specific protein-glutamate methyltransferase CheB [Bosea sp. (in: a-proteobacteria)]|jgi:two-component system chemotaxis response regulator CheB|uniref:chemotaxis-specific protein-glutamate methyltransferase CheB n=1 Tax=Bosea sp. (in: a-proteobacteria) TaxID=1871050 RepID=UPI002DDC9D88|nr:chemotaxis-specific protein-glutamate methyltransferase CheB [Bosea sp. (in: a-proteobacteria)]HEV2511348.1 chemotaxis-specific protein-glutamate methyltransferase CheB [Bosea sp. (in: a-proteobacteria)]